MHALRKHTNTHDRLIPYLLLAVTVHALALYLMKIPLPPPAMVQATLTLNVGLSEPIPVPSRPALERTPPPLQQQHQQTNSNIQTTSSPSAKPAEQTTTEIPPISTAEVTEKSLTPSPRTISIQTLLDSARIMGKEDEKLRPTQQNNHTQLAERPILAKLAAILADSSQSRPGITQYADGTIKVVTAYGTVYCTKSPPDLAKTGPLAPEAMAMTCP